MSLGKMKSFQILTKSFQDKKRQSNGISMRLLAEKMEISHSFLSRALQGKKSLSKTQIDKICRLLEVDEVTRSILDKALIREASHKRGIESVDTHLTRKARFEAVEEFETIKDKNFTLYDDWFLIPIMDLTTLKQFKGTATWVAARLGITETEADEGLKKLVREGHLKKTEKGFIKTNKKIRIATVKSLPKIRAYHRQMILKALNELETKTDEESFQKRLISGICLAVNPEQLPKARQIIQAAMHEAVEVLLQGPCTDLYHLNTQLFPIIKK